MKTIHGILLSASLLASARAQTEPPQPPTGPLDGSTAMFSAGWRVPIHTNTPEPGVTAAEVWAAGNGYKVSFHDGMEIHPILGASAPRGFPLRWATTRVAVGEQTLHFDEPGATPAKTGRRAGEWQYRYDLSPAIEEVYDVLSDGVEQSFVIQKPVSVATGALVVEGQLQTDLLPRLVERPGQPGVTQAEVHLAIREGSEPTLRYGVAIAFDATGRRTAVETTLIESALGHRVSLRVPEAFVAQATWPITVDPLISANILEINPDNLVTSDVAVSTGPSTRRVMTVWSVATTSTDQDLYAVLSNGQLSANSVVFSDLSASMSSEKPSVAFIRSAGANGRWAIAFHRVIGTFVAVRVWLHDQNSIVPQSGTIMFLPHVASGTAERNPDIGGSNGNTGLLVYQSDVTSSAINTPRTEVRYAFVNASTFAFQGDARVAAFSSIFVDREEATVTHTADAIEEDWIVCYQQRTLTSQPPSWSIRGRRISRFGTSGDDTQILASSSTLTPNLIQPAVDGKFGNFAVAALESSNDSSGTRVVMRRFLWGGSALPSFVWDDTVDTTGVISPFRQLSITHDTTSRSHWGLTYRQGVDVLLRRVGFNGDVVDEEVSISDPSARAPNIAFDPVEGRYVHTYGASTLFSRGFYGQLWTYPAAVNIPLGGGCGGVIGAARLPLLGDEAWFTSLNNAVPNTPAVLFLGFSRATLDLSSIGMLNCTLYVGGPIVSIPRATNGTGFSSFGLDLTSPISIYLQWLYVAPGANTLGLLATGGIEARIR